MARKPPKGIELKKTFALIVEGQTEKIYFSKLNRQISNLNVSINPQLPKHLQGIEYYEKLYNELLDEEFDDVCIVLDGDTKQKFKNIPKDKIYETNPCFELWFLLHFEKVGKTFNDCNQLIKTLKKFIKNYSKDKNFLNQNLFKLLYNNNFNKKIKDTINRAKETEKNTGTRTRVHILIQKITKE